MPYKPTGRKPGRPKKVKDIPPVRSELPPGQTVSAIRVPLNAGQTFDSQWAALTPREKQLARYAADQRGMTLPALLAKFPMYRSGGV